MRVLSAELLSTDDTLVSICTKRVASKVRLSVEPALVALAFDAAQRHLAEGVEVEHQHPVFLVLLYGAFEGEHAHFEGEVVFGVDFEARAVEAQALVVGFEFVLDGSGRAGAADFFSARCPTGSSPPARCSSSCPRGRRQRSSLLATALFTKLPMAPRMPPAPPSSLAVAFVVGRRRRAVATQVVEDVFGVEGRGLRRGARENGA